MKNTIIVPVVIVLVFIAVGIFVISKDDTNSIGNKGTTKNSEIVAGDEKPVTTTSASVVLNLSGRGLTAVPMSAFSDTKTEELNLSNNALTGALPSQVGALQNLKVLNLSNNNFTGVPAEIGQLSKLEVLDLSDNKLTGLPNELGNLLNLKLLDVSGNQYSKADLDGIKKNLPSSTVIKTE